MRTSHIKKGIKKSILLLVGGVMLSGLSCKENTSNDQEMQQTEIDTRETVQEVVPRAFTGEIRSVGDSGATLSGEVAMRIEGDLMRFYVNAEGLAPDMMHMQYLLVSQSGDETQCPGSIEDLTNNSEETAASGTTLRRIPLHMGGTLDMDSDTYPRTNINGKLEFSHVISLDTLRNALSTQYQMQDLDFSKFTFVIRGIPDKQPSGAPSPGSTTSVEGTPVGCAKLQETAISS